ncbi:unnamed protein product [Angiostrongylus costaricensis]|uniref:C2H2-type domain-containing protein n=1 Tax=Angiostrongylus costaricensis TaxID=334426 RepID=A0A0R3PSF4_ANGCS|nr:unnamed protein product [Angiostrongylus costaricensis]
MKEREERDLTKPSKLIASSSSMNVDDNLLIVCFYRVKAFHHFYFRYVRKKEYLPDSSVQFKFPFKEAIKLKLSRNLRPFKCEQCGTEFGRAGGLRRHDIMVHQQKKHACPYEGCSHPGYKCTKALAAHIRSVHTLDRPFACLFCEKTFVRKNDLKVHELTHSNRSRFFCSKCNSRK